MRLRGLLLAVSLVLYATAPEDQLRGRLRGQPNPTDATAHLWVDTDGGTCVDNASPVVYDSATACGTIDAAMDAADAGDTVRVKAGNYSGAVSPGANGSAGSSITVVADGTVGTCFWTFASKSYIRVIGFTIGGSGTGCSTGSGTTALTFTGTNDHLEFWHNTVQDVDVGLSVANTGGAALNNTLIIANLFQRISDGSGGAIAIGAWNQNHNLIAYNEFDDNRPDAAFVMGTFNRWLNNYAHDLSEAEGGHVDFFQAGSSNAGFADSLFEANIQIGTGAAADEHVTNWSNGQAGNGTGFMGRNVLRRNVWHNLSGPCLSVNQTSSGPLTPTGYYHNTTAVAMANNSGSPNGCHAAFGTNAPDVLAVNNIEYQSWVPEATTNVGVWVVDGTFTANYNLAYDPDGSVTFNSVWTNQANELSNVNPNFADFANDDFSLGAGSGDGANARGTGGPITTTSGSGTGTTFSVVAGFGYVFRGDDTNLDQYGGNLVAGDVLTVGTDTCTVVSVSTDAITCAETFTWANGESVYFGTDTSPDIGAYPYLAGGYSLSATYSVDGGTATITPNDASLVRFVICFEDGIPTTVDNASPYTCSVGSGTKVFRVYPRFASKTLWATASQ